MVEAMITDGRLRAERTLGGYIAEIDSVRAIAVLLVLLFHAYPQWFPGGFIGVDVFFVVSGFVIARAYLDNLISGRATVADFIHARFRRLLPAFAVVLVATSVAAYLILLPDDLLRYANALVAQPFYLQNVVFWNEGDYFEGALRRPLLHTWSLAVEEQFYVLFALLLLVFPRSPRVLGACLAIGVLGSILFGVMIEASSPKTPFFLLPGRVWQIGLGVAAWLAVRRVGERRLTVNVAAPAACIAGIVFSGLGFDETARFPGLQSYLACGATALGLFLFATSKACFGGLAPSTARYIGSVSYPLYLWHWPILSLLGLHFDRPPLPIEATWALAVTFALAELTRRYVEQPFRSRRLLPQSRDIFRLSAATLSAVLVCGVLLQVTKGAVFRYPEDIALYFEAAQERSPFRCSKLFRITNPDGSICHINSVERGSGVAIIGDSHADMLDETIAAVGEDLGVPVFLAVRNCDLGAFGTHRFCSKAHLQKLIAEARENGVQHVLAVSRLDGRTLSLARFVSDVETIGTAGMSVTVVLQTPYEPGRYAPSYRARLALQGAALMRAGTSRERFAQISAPQIDVIGKLQAVRHDVAVIDPMDWLCPDAACTYEVNGYPLYHDHDHLNSHGAAFLKPMFYRYFRDRIGSASQLRTGLSATR